MSEPFDNSELFRYQVTPTMSKPLKGLDVAAAQVSELVKQLITALEVELSCQILTHPGETPDLTIQFFGPGTTILNANGQELLKALEIVLAEVRAPEKPELLSCGTVEV